MQLVIVSSDALENDLLSKEFHENIGITWIDEAREALKYKDADAFLHLNFEDHPEDTEWLMQLLPKPVIVNSVINTLQRIGHPFIRLNGWPGFLQLKIWEVAALSESSRLLADPVFAALGKKVEWVDDAPGLVSPRVVSMIINEAFLAWGEGVSSREDIDKAMKLGTSYPYGPFEWSDKIGLKKIKELLQILSGTMPHYSPAPSLVDSVEL